jgi:S-formylglutathione hydrolase
MGFANSHATRINTGDLMLYQLVETHTCFQGAQNVYSHWSECTNSTMRFALFLPAQAKKSKVPIVYWLSGLTCSEQNFITKAGAQRVAAALGIAIAVPDTSPRGYNQEANQDYLGEGASFYIDATQTPWQDHYQMYSYISQELPRFITTHFPIDDQRCGIFGHSMGGHGALTVGLRNPQIFHSISAFAPIASLMHAPWGKNALRELLGTDEELWQDYDASAVLLGSSWPHGEILIDQGTADPFLEEQLKNNILIDAAAKANIKLTLRLHENYDHSYYFVSSFMEEHLHFHANKWFI